MKFRFHNIGPVEDAELELGRLTIIAGRNNTGKTYLAYTLYGLLQQRDGWPSWRGRQGPFPGMAATEAGDGPRGVEPLDVREIAASLSREGLASRRVDGATLSRERAAMARALGSDYSKSLVRHVFSAPDGAFEDARLGVEWADPFPKNVAPIDVRSVGPGAVSVGFDGARVSFRADISKRRHPVLYRQGVEAAYTHFLLSALPTPFVLTAERFGIALFHRELDFTKNRLVQLLQQIDRRNGKNTEAPFWVIDRATSRYATPIQDNIDYTRSLPEIRRESSEVQEQRLFNGIKDMMDGDYRISDGEVRFVSRRRKGHRFDLPLYRASSSARGLSDLYFYLRHAAHQDHLLIVDEPESHLDTENQVQLAHLLSRIVKSGIRVLITTHSDYIVKEINNLLMLGRLNLSRTARRKVGYREDIGLEEKDVRAYVAEGGSLRKCRANAYGLDFPVFDTTIDSINDRSADLTERVMESEPSE